MKEAMFSETILADGIDHLEAAVKLLKAYASATRFDNYGPADSAASLAERALADAQAELMSCVYASEKNLERAC